MLNRENRIDVNANDANDVLKQAIAENYKEVLKRLKKTTKFKRKELMDCIIVSINPQLNEMLVKPYIKNLKHINGDFQEILLEFTEIMSTALSTSLLMDFGLNDSEISSKKRYHRRGRK